MLPLTPPPEPFVPSNDSIIDSNILVEDSIHAEAFPLVKITPPPPAPPPPPPPPAQQDIPISKSPVKLH